MRSGLRASKVESFNYEYEIPADGVPLQSKKVTPGDSREIRETAVCRLGTYYIRTLRTECPESGALPGAARKTRRTECGGVMINRDPSGAAPYWVPPHVRFCVTSTGAVVLDLKRTRYFGIGSKETRALATLALNWSRASVVDGDSIELMPSEEALGNLANLLVTAGLLATAPPSEEPLACQMHRLDLRSVECEHHYRGFPRMRHILALARAFRWAKRAINSRDLYSIVREIEREKVLLLPVTESDTRLAIESVSAFRRLRPYAFTAKDQCLVHALTLTKFLMLSGTSPTWIIAVRPRPWAAHSWVQLNNLVLDSNPEEVNGYTPILAV